MGVKSGVLSDIKDIGRMRDTSEMGRMGYIAEHTQRAICHVGEWARETIVGQMRLE